MLLPQRVSIVFRLKVVGASQAWHFGGVVECKAKGAPITGYPTIEEVEQADKEQLARWYRFLPSGETRPNRG
jgi:hypothetical protein